MPRRARRALTAAVLAAALGAPLGACAASNGAQSTLQGTRPIGVAADAPSTVAGAAGAPSTAVTSAPGRPGGNAGSPATTAAKGPSDVTLGGATQMTAAPGTTAAPAAGTTVPIVAPTPAGFQRAADPEGTVSIAVPSAWTLVPLDAKTLEQIAGQSANFPAETREQLQDAVAQAGEYMKILAVGPADLTGLSPNVNVVVVPGASPVSILKTVYPQQVKAFGGTVVATDELTVDSRPAIRFRLELTGTAGVVASTQVIVPVEGRTVIISYANVPPELVGTLVAAVVVPKR